MTGNRKGSGAFEYGIRHVAERIQRAMIRDSNVGDA
jgi:hypothetical protein